MNETNLREVDFDKYCKACKYKETPEAMDPCNECLDYGMNYETEKPVSFKEKDA